MPRLSKKESEELSSIHDAHRNLMSLHENASEKVRSRLGLAPPKAFMLEEKQSLKVGGLVRGKKNEAVPIVAHGGELVVPQHVVKKVIKSNAWLDHVASVRKEHGGTMKEAMKRALETYKKE